MSTDNILSQRVKQRLLEAWRSTYNTIFDGARNPAILDGGLKIDPFSAVSFDKLDFENSIERIQMDMAKALGVPYVLLKSTFQPLLILCLTPAETDTSVINDVILGVNPFGYKLGTERLSPSLKLSLENA